MATVRRTKTRFNARLSLPRSIRKSPRWYQQGRRELRRALTRWYRAERNGGYGGHCPRCSSCSIEGCCPATYCDSGSRTKPGCARFYNEDEMALRKVRRVDEDLFCSILLEVEETDDILGLPGRQRFPLGMVDEAGNPLPILSERTDDDADRVQ